jgi:hypothetical protein
MKRNINTSREAAPSQSSEPMSASVGSASGQRARAHGEVALDTSLSNTVSNKYIPEYFKPLRWGVDSLYLSFAGELHPDVEHQLELLKELAQSDKLEEQAFAQIKLGEHIFEVKDKSTGMFAFTLVDNCFRINISRSRAKSLPMAYVQISSEYLTHKAHAEIVLELQKLLSELGNVNSSASVSRIDLFVDFGSNESMESWDRHAWLTRSDNIDQYSIKGMFSGWTIGLGSPLAGRLYDKILEIVSSKKDYLLPLWKQAGWNGDSRIWRMEFEFKREVLRQLNIKTYEDAKQNLNGLWDYATTNWLRLTLPNPADSNRSRWPLHHLWGYISAIDFETFGGELSRTFSSQRIPSDQRLFSHGFSVLSSFMAREGLTDLGAAMELYHTHLYHYINTRSMNEGVTFEGFIGERVGVKAKRFNSILNKQKELDRQHDADDYRRMSDGE